MGAKRKPKAKPARDVAAPAAALHNETKAAARALVAALDRYIVARSAELAAEDRFYDQNTSPLGRRRHLRLCSTGKLEGARKIGNRWVVKCAVVDSYIATHGGVPSGDSESEQAMTSKLLGGRAA